MYFDIVPNVIIANTILLFMAITITENYEIDSFRNFRINKFRIATLQDHI